MSKPTHDTRLIDYLHDIYLLERVLKASTAYQMDRSIRRFNEWFGKPATIADLDEATVSRFVRDLDEAGDYAARSLHRMRSCVLTVWRHAADYDLCDYPRDRRVRKVKIPNKAPVAWTIKDYEKLLAACSKLPGALGNGLLRKLYFSTFLRVAWDTGFRRSDLFAIRLDQIGFDTGTVVVVEEKTGSVEDRQLRPATLEAIQRTMPPIRERPLAWPNSLRQFYFWNLRLAALAGVPYGGPQQARRSAATAVDAKQEGAATVFLGHKTPGLAKKHYIDPRISRKQRPMPPALEEQDA